jgi:hypothetical protein
MSALTRGKQGEAMKIQYALVLALATGLALGAVVTRSLHARTPPPAYFVAQINEITDAKGFETLRKMGPANIAEAKMLDGRYLARTENITGLMELRRNSLSLLLSTI